jgi:phage major head subunit gpT-like protein
MPLLQNEEHKRLHTLGPKDVSWGQEDKPVSIISITKSVSEGEQWSVNVPVFGGDSRESLKDRAWMLATLLQERLDEYAEAWKEADSRLREADQKDTGTVTKLKK